jgi:GT2 family glycosyltransferase/LmbE family N-acetylglucosaminyl deacetylase
LVIVDDATPGGLKDLPSRFGADKLVIRERQGGFTASVNSGLLALPPTIGAAVLLNSDMQVLDGWLDALLRRWAGAEEVGVVGGMELSAEEPNHIVSGGTRPVIIDGELTNLGQLDREGWLSRGDLQEPALLEWAAFGIALITRRCFEALGPLDERFVNYFSDADYGRRASLAGFLIWYEPMCRVLHTRHASTRLNTRAGLISLQADRERYCEKWRIADRQSVLRERRWSRWLTYDRGPCWPRLVPHLDLNAPVGSVVAERLAATDGIRQDVKRIRDSAAVTDITDALGEFRRLYVKGLAFIDAVEPRGSPRGGRPFLDGTPLQVLAPHPDDAALSVGPLLLAHSEGAAPTCVTSVFGRSAYAQSPLAGLDVNTISRVRALEEATYCAAVGADFRVVPLSDRLIRHPTDPIFLIGVEDLELDVLADVLDILAPLFADPSPAIFLAPLAAGLMADHALVAVAVASAMSRGFPRNRVIVYEDLPYATTAPALRLGLDLWARFGVRLRPHVAEVSRWFDHNCELLTIYASQLGETHLAIANDYASALLRTQSSGEVDDWRRALRLWIPDA